ncbi:MAG: ATP-binding protein [Candidatus Micrarchaeia archaeon]
MLEEAVREYLVDFQKRTLPQLVERELQIHESKKVKSIIGPRRAGKTYFMYQQMKKLLADGVRKENILYLNFEDPRLSGITFREIRELAKLHWQLYPESLNEKLHIFIDEPQNIEKWEQAVRSLHDEEFDIYLSGSSSKLLSREIATSLRGRTIAYMLLPFSFREFLKMHNLTFDVNRISTEEKATLLHLLDEYLTFGGFPEVALEDNQENKLKILSEYFNLLVYRDVVERYKIKNSALAKWLIKTLSASFSKEFSIHKIYLTLKSQGVRVGKNTLYAYVSMLEDSIFAFFVPKFHRSIRKRELAVSKVYLSDLGFAKLVEVSEEKGRKMENAVFLELERRRGPLTNIFYWKNPQQEEVDFVIQKNSKVQQLIQVCKEVWDRDVRKR